MNKTTFGILIFLVVVAFGWFALSKTTPTMSGPIKVGVLASLTGDAAAYGEAARNIMQMAADEINANGGVHGQPLELIIEDSKCNGEDAVNAAQKLINVDKVQIIIGGFCSSESLAILPIATQAKVALLSPGSSSPDLTGASEYFARDYPSDANQGAVLATIAYDDKGWRNIAFIQEQTDYALGVYKAFSETFTKLGGAVTNEPFPSGTNDFRSLIAKVKGKNADAVFVSTQGAAAAKILFTQMEQNSWSPKLVLIDTVIADTETLQMHKVLLEGALGAEVGTDPANPKFSALVSNYKERYGTDLPYASLGQTEYDAVYLVADAVKAVGYDGTKLANWFHTSVKGWDGASGSVTIGENGDRIGAHKPEVVENGTVVPYVR